MSTHVLRRSGRARRALMARTPGKPGLQTMALVAANVVGLGAFLWPFVLPAAVGGEQAHALDAPVILVLLLACL